jgi:hypothetical protein
MTDIIIWFTIAALPITALAFDIASLLTYFH